MRRTGNRTSGNRHSGNRFSQFLYLLSLVFLVLGLFILGWSAWPAPTDAVQFAIPAGRLPGAPAGFDFPSLSDYALNISWPRWIRQEEVGLIHLRLTDLNQEPLPGNEARATQIVLVEPALYPLPIMPRGSVQVNLGDDQELLLTWEVSGINPGDFPGKMYLSFGFFPEAFPTDDEPQQDLVVVPVAVVDLHIRVIGLWGLDPGLVIWFGLVSLVLWGALFILGRIIAERSTVKGKR